MILPDTPLSIGVGAQARGAGNAAVGAGSRSIDGETDTLSVGTAAKPRNVGQVKDATRDDHAVTYRQLRQWFNTYGGVVKDIVGTRADLTAYPVANVKIGDLIGVLKDETHDNKPSYYKYTATNVWTYVGSVPASLSFVSHDATMGGDGTPGNPLYVAGPAETAPFIADLSSQLDGVKTVLISPIEIPGPFNVFQNGKCLFPTQYSLAADRRTLTLYTSPQQAWPVEACWVQSLRGFGAKGDKGDPGANAPSPIQTTSVDAIAVSAANPGVFCFVPKLT